MLKNRPSKNLWCSMEETDDVFTECSEREKAEILTISECSFIINDKEVGR